MRYAALAVALALAACTRVDQPRDTVYVRDTVLQAVPVHDTVRVAAEANGVRIIRVLGKVRIIHDTVRIAELNPEQKLKYVSRAAYDECAADRAEAVLAIKDYIADQKRRLATRNP